MKELYYTKPDKNGVSIRIIVDYKNKTIIVGYILYNQIKKINSMKIVSKKEIKGLVCNFIRKGFKRIYG